MDYADFRSDTVTRPTAAMRKAMAEAPVGDDVYGEDPTVIELQNLAAEMTGKEAALLVPSGTMGNQVSIMAQTHPGQELITSQTNHIIRYEGGGTARLSGLSAALCQNEGGFIYPEDVRRLCRPKGDAHFPQSRLLCLENALGGGGVVPLDSMEALHSCARELGLLVHLDGARLFNAAAALGCEAKDLAQYADSLTFCLSKGLCAPIGSLICGGGEFIEKAKYCRKVMGGGMRQAGIIAAAGLVALRDMVPRLKDDHELARHLAREMAQLPEVEVDLERVRINMLFWKPLSPNFKADEFVRFMLDHNIKVGGPYQGEFRLVCHNDVGLKDAGAFLAALKEYLLTLE